jgi:hypothetical protein
MKYKDYKDLTDEDIWTTDAISCDEFALTGKEAICSEIASSEADFFVSAETIPENLFSDEDEDEDWTDGEPKEETETSNENNNTYYVNCPFCGEHSTDVNDYWDDTEERFICECGTIMEDGWE